MNSIHDDAASSAPLSGTQRGSADAAPDTAAAGYVDLPARVRNGVKCAGPNAACQWLLPVPIVVIWLIRKLAIDALTLPRRFSCRTGSIALQPSGSGSGRGRTPVASDVVRVGRCRSRLSFGAACRSRRVAAAILREGCQQIRVMLDQRRLLPRIE